VCVSLAEETYVVECVNMQASAEISHKVRLAIKTKLTELGAYVDDELPDYVLVMVANRRGRQDMKKELELFLGEATDKFCSWLFGVLDKLKDAKKTAKDGKRTSESEPEIQLKEDDIKKDVKKNDIGAKLEKLAGCGDAPPEKKQETKRNKKTRKVSKSPSPSLLPPAKEAKRRNREEKVEKKKRHHSNRQSYSRSRSRSRSPRSRSRRDSKKDTRNKSRSPEATREKKRDKKKKKEALSPSPEPVVEKRKKSEKEEKKKKSKVSSSVVVAKKEKSNPKPTSSLIIRAINQASTPGGGGGGLFSGTGLMRSITVKANGVTETTEIKTGSKRKSGELGTVGGGGTKSKQSDKRVFVTKNGDAEIKTKATITLGDLGKVKNGKSSPQSQTTRSKSPKFFVTLHEGDKKKTIKTKDPKNIIINPSDSDEDSDNELANNTNAIETAEKIKQQQEQNSALVSLNTQSVTLNLNSLGDNNPDARTVFVSGLDWKLGETELQEHFGIIGQVVRITILKDRYTGCSKGCAYIQYATVEQKKTACEAFDKTDFHSRQISVGDKLPPGQHNQQLTATAVAAAPRDNTAFSRPENKSQFKYIPPTATTVAGDARSKYQWTKPGFMPPR